MIRYVPFEAVDQPHVVHLANSLLGAPVDNRPDVDDLLRAIVLGTMRLFEFSDGDNTGIVLVGQTEQRMVVYGFAADHLRGIPKRLADDLKRLAADWKCDTIETTCFDRRFASVIEHLGGSVESVTVTLAVE